MRIPRFTIAGGMLLVLLVAANFGALRFVRSQSPRDMTFGFAVVALPMANIVALLGAKFARQVRRTGEGGSFLLGFLAAGIPITLFVATGMLSSSEVFEQYYRITLDWLSPTIKSLIDSKMPVRVVAGYILGFGLIGLDFTLPQVAIAALSGWICKSLGLRIVRRRTDNSQPLPAIETAR